MYFGFCFFICSSKTLQKVQLKSQSKMKKKTYLIEKSVARFPSQWNNLELLKSETTLLKVGLVAVFLQT